jgi:hypothetical protein
MPKGLSDFRATDFEFRARFWIIGGVFCLGFALYAAGDINSLDLCGGGDGGVAEAFAETTT